MTQRVQCFWLEPTDQVEVSLRRYCGLEKHQPCTHSGMSYHNASQVLERGPAASYPDYIGNWHPHTDSGWPQTCACGRVFAESDEWQARPEQLFKRGDTGELVTQDNAPPGAMMHAHWLVGWDGYRLGADGVMLMVKLPDHKWWTVDGPTYKDGKQQGGSWSRSGVIPNVTAAPSIDTGSYHGWLSQGYLVKC